MLRNIWGALRTAPVSANLPAGEGEGGRQPEGYSPVVTGRNSIRRSRDIFCKSKQLSHSLYATVWICKTPFKVAHEIVNDI